MRFLALLVVIPISAWLFAQWIDFWIQRSLGQWMACGLGVPVAIAVAIIWWAGEEDSLRRK